MTGPTVEGLRLVDGVRRALGSGWRHRSPRVVVAVLSAERCYRRAARAARAHGAAVLDAVELDERPSLPYRRLELAFASGGRTFVTVSHGLGVLGCVVFGPGRSAPVPVSEWVPSPAEEGVLVTNDELRHLDELRGRVGRIPRTLTEGAPPGVALLVLYPDPPASIERSDLEAARDALTDLASGVPTEWVARRLRG